MAAPGEEVLLRVQTRAAELVKFAASNFQLQLDFTEASIQRVEKALAGIHRQFGAKAEENKAAIVNLSEGFGSYIGEVLRRKHGGEWRMNLPKFPPAVEGLVVEGTIVAPMQQVFLRVTKGSQYNVEDFYGKAIAAIMERRAAISLGPRTAPEAETPGEMKQAAEAMAEAMAEARERFGIDLDLTEASLSKLDQVFLELHKLLTDNVPSAKRLSETDKFLLKPTAAVRYTGYFRELVCANLGAKWQRNVPGCKPEVVALTLGGKLAELKIRGQVVSIPQMVVNCINDPRSWSIKNYYLDVKRTHQAESRLASASSFDDKMAVVAQEAVSIARDRYDITLDFSEASVQELEKLLARIHAELPKPGDPKRPSDEWIKNVALTFGVYLGEVFRKNLGGKWLKENPHAPGSLPAISVAGSTLTPCRKTLKRILDGPVEDVAYFYKVAGHLIQEKLPKNKL